MKFISGKRIIRNISLKQLQQKIENISTPNNQIEKGNNSDLYYTKLRIHINIKGYWYWEIPTSLTTKESKNGIQIIVKSELLKPLLFSSCFMIFMLFIFYLTKGFFTGMLAISLLFPILLFRFKVKIENQAAELLNKIKIEVLKEKI